MSAELSEQLAGWDSVQSLLGEILTSHNEFEQFFSEVFEQLGSLSGDLTQQKDQWESEREQTKKKLQQRATQLEAERAALAAEREQLAEVTRGGCEQETSAANQRDIRQFLEVAEQQRAELCGTQEAVQTQLARLAAVADELAEARSTLAEDANSGGGDEQLSQLLGEVQRQREELHGVQEAAQAQTERLAAAAAELTEARNDIIRRCEQFEQSEAEAARSQPDEQLRGQLRKMEQQQAEWEQERKVLELELETIRNRAAEMAESLADQKRLAGQQRTQWSDELKRMRGLLETITARLAEPQPGPGFVPPEPEKPTAADPVGPSAAAGEDPVLDSVMAQFEMLQKDLARRRAAKC